MSDAKITTVGAGSCGACDQALDNIPLTRETKQAPDGGTWWRVQDGHTCSNCGQSLDWMYEKPIVLEVSARRVPAHAS
jgi:hypothetical protein